MGPGLCYRIFSDKIMAIEISEGGVRKSNMLFLFLLSPLPKGLSGDVTMRAVHFWGQDRDMQTCSFV